MSVVSNTSPLSHLSAIGKLEILREIYGEIVVPPAVAEELADRRQEHPLDVVVVPWIRVQSPIGPPPPTLSRFIHRGEEEAITLAIEMGAELLLIDERKGREEARRLRVPIAGVLGILLTARKRALIPSVAELIERLDRETDFWMSEKLIRMILRAAGEAGDR
ncbi:MAG: DUF3368 domain-containing protein [Planctomycetes bacterium]|nr:DUF3368 domain-containing protein [Planctomycetota bacterium]